MRTAFGIALAAPSRGRADTRALRAQIRKYRAAAKRARGMARKFTKRSQRAQRSKYLKAAKGYRAKANALVKRLNRLLATRRTQARTQRERETPDEIEEGTEEEEGGEEEAEDTDSDEEEESGESESAGILGAIQSFFAKATAGGIRYRDYTFPDGYTYRQFKDSEKSILILKSPAGPGGVVLYPDTPNPKAYRAISDAIAQVRAGRTAKAIKIGGVAAVTILQALTPKPPRRRRRRPQATPMQEPMAPPPSSFPVLPVAIGGGLVVLALVLRPRRAT